jgi:hypothetical protein
MASAGTLLSDLDGQTASGNDGDLVQKILQDMSVSNTQRGPPPPPAMPAQQQQQYQQMPTTVSPLTMDSRIPTAHVIGNEHPTPADFAAAMAGMNNIRPHEQSMMGAPVGTMPGYTTTPTYEPPTKNIYGRILDELKVPFVVALLFFVFSLPPIRVLVAHYIPMFIKPTGDFTIVGLGVTSLVVAVSFWFLQRVISPLLSL